MGFMIVCLCATEEKKVKVEGKKVTMNTSLLLMTFVCLLRRNKARGKQKTYKSVGVMKD